MTDQLLARLMTERPEIVLVGRTRFLAEAVVALSQRPQLVIMDWILQDGTGRELLHAMRTLAVRSRALVMMEYPNEASVAQVLAAGAAGCINRHASFGEFAQAVLTVAAGQRYLGSSVAVVGRNQPVSLLPRGGSKSLTPRETEVLRMVGEGCASKQIAAVLNLSVRTVENHRASIMRKTGLRSAAQLAVHAVQLGLVQLPGASEARQP